MGKQKEGIKYGLSNKTGQEQNMDTGWFVEFKKERAYEASRGSADCDFFHWPFLALLGQGLREIRAGETQTRWFVNRFDKRRILNYGVKWDFRISMISNNACTADVIN